MARLRGRAQKGERLRAGIPQGHWKTTTFVAGLRLTGMTAPMVLDGPMNGTAFLAYVQQPDVAHVVAFAEGTFNPVAQMGNPACFSLFTPEELDIIQWDSLEEEMANSIEYDIVPDYERLLEIMTAARRV